MYFEKRDREGVVRMFEQMRNAIAAMDAIGWVEQQDTPDSQPVNIDEQLVQWAKVMADELAISLTEAGEGFDPDADLDALSALRTIGKAT